MTDPDDRAALALRRLGTSAVPVEQPEELSARRARLLPSLTDFAERELSRSARARRLRRFGAVAAAAAVLVVAGSWLAARRAPSEATLREHHGTVRVVHAGAASEVGDERRLATADLLETLDGTAEVSLVTGAVVDLSERSRLELSQVDRSSSAVSERVRLSSGKVSVRVPKLSPGSKLMVATPDATVTVHGTAFTVEVTSAEGTASTTVRVTEGRVAVDSGGRQLFLGPGAQWSSAPRAVATPSPAMSAGSSDAKPEVPPATGSAIAARSTLSRENRLFQAAMAASRRGEPERAIALAEQLLRKYPDTPLADEARQLVTETRQKLAPGTTP